MLLTTTKEDANLNYLKNRGQPGEWFQHKADYIEDKPVPRIRNEGFEVIEKCKPTIGEIIVPNRFSVMKQDDIHVRLTTIDAKKIADKFNFQEDKWFDFPGNLYYKPPKAPRKIRLNTAKEIAENNWQQRSHDWFSHNRPKTSASYTQLHKCVGTVAIENSKKMQSSHADQWYGTWSKKDIKVPSSAPNSPKGRNKFEGIEYARRARGVGAELLMHSQDYDKIYDDTAIPYRCGTVEAGEICRIQTKGSSMARCLGYQTNLTERTNEPQDRVKSDAAREYLNRSRCGTMNLSVDGTSVSLKPKVRPEAEEFYIKARGNIGTIIDQSQNKGYSSPQPCQRILSNEARRAFETNQGVMSSVVGRTSYRPPVYKPKNHARGNIGPEAKEFLQKSLGSSMKQLVENYKLPSDAPPKQRVGASGWEEGGLKRASSVGHLLNEYGKKATPTIPPLRLYREAIEIGDKHRSKDFFKTIQQIPPSK